MTTNEEKAKDPAMVQKIIDRMGVESRACKYLAFGTMCLSISAHTSFFTNFLLSIFIVFLCFLNACYLRNERLHRDAHELSCVKNIDKILVHEIKKATFLKLLKAFASWSVLLYYVILIAIVITN